MRLGLIAALAALAALGTTADAAAGGIAVETKIAAYPVAGKSGEELLLQMNRKGPRHGFLTRAIAQTSYVVKWDFAWESEKGGCRLKDADARLAITYTYPRATSKMPAALARKWQTFLRGVRRHEETHGTLARRMVAAAQRSIAGVAFPRDAGCRAARAEVKRRVDAVYAVYESRQRAFDAREHADNGKVVRLVEALAR